MALTQIGVVGSGMIMEDQDGPAIAQLVRRGVLGQIHIAAQGSASLRRLLGLSWWRERFPDLPEGWVMRKSGSRALGIAAVVAMLGSLAFGGTAGAAPTILILLVSGNGSVVVPGIEVPSGSFALLLLKHALRRLPSRCGWRAAAQEVCMNRLQPSLDLRLLSPRKRMLR